MDDKILWLVEIKYFRGLGRSEFVSVRAASEAEALQTIKEVYGSATRIGLVAKIMHLENGSEP